MAWGTFLLMSRWAISCLKEGLERLPGWFVHFLASQIHKPQNCIFDTYTHCGKNADLMFSFLMSWSPAERKKVVSEKVPHGQRGVGGQQLFGQCLFERTTFQKGASLKSQQRQTKHSFTKFCCRALAADIFTTALRYLSMT